MFGIHDLGLFIVSGLLLNMAPGPDSLLIVSRSAAQGWRSGSAAALGIGSGTLVHIFAAALGLSALLATSAMAFTMVKYIGAAYLIYMGGKLLLSRPAAPAISQPVQVQVQVLAYRAVFLQGFFCNLLNPKIALFFLAFVPQFISDHSPSKALAFILLGCIFNANGMLWCHFLAISSAKISQRIRISNAFTCWTDRTIGAIFISFGIKLALYSRN
ncbi:LysE family translocator [Iodobacter fluviatilis]|uniref:Leucine efflux protein n=1 Tax=Iodobacter fluviatilis TaxID=537 RepID=A0A377Q867_9NEIS|nr:LysE family translocator [Iodobacter fluviatilis]TCU89655.1 threonine/homoserine/homoserine lactone efflux protein [Iodobacter fluviatilis]STQ91027.1 Leucine efflux protein [Iodobacter fluviatilis]